MGATTPLDLHRLYRTAKNLSVEPDGEGTVRVLNEAYGSGFSAPLALIEVLRFFETPSTIAAFRDQFESADDGLFEALVESFLLLEESSFETMAYGLTSPARRPIGRPVLQQDLKQSMTSKAFSVVGAATDVCASSPGARGGPTAIREKMVLRFGADEGAAPPRGHVRFLNDIESRRTVDLETIEVIDVGDVVSVGGSSIAEYGLRLSTTIGRVIGCGFMPIMLGGDHSVTRYALEAIGQRYAPGGFGIIHFDAHHDLYPSLKDEVTHANPFEAVLRGDGVRYLYQVGLRTLEPVLPMFQPGTDDRVRYVSAFELQYLNPADVFADLPTDIPVYVSFDVDCMAPDVCPETGTPVAGGLSYYQALALIDAVARKFTCIGCDFVEVASSNTKVNGAATVVASLLTRFVLAHASSEPLGSYIQVRRPRTALPLS